MLNESGEELKLGFYPVSLVSELSIAALTNQTNLSNCGFKQQKFITCQLRRSEVQCESYLAKMIIKAAFLSAASTEMSISLPFTDWRMLTFPLLFPFQHLQN